MNNVPEKVLTLCNNCLNPTLLKLLSKILLEFSQPESVNLSKSFSLTTLGTMRLKQLASGFEACHYCGLPTTLVLGWSADALDGETKLILAKTALDPPRTAGSSAP